jgi:hypothetical protein
MRYETAEAFRTALEQRLKNEAEASGIALMRLRKRVAFERFLARLAASEPSGWVLKGAFALELRLGLRTRATKDIDLGRADDEEAANGHLNAATGVDLEDFFDFEVRRTPALDAAAGFHAVRYTVRADLAGRRFEQFPVDIALSESSLIQAEPLFGANSLEFADVAAPQLPVISLEQHVAEKLHAPASRSQAPYRRHRRRGPGPTRCWLARSGSQSSLRRATQRPLGCSTRCSGRKLASLGPRSAALALARVARSCFDRGSQQVWWIAPAKSAVARASSAIRSTTFSISVTAARHASSPTASTSRQALAISSSRIASALFFPGSASAGRSISVWSTKSTVTTAPISSSISSWETTRIPGSGAVMKG